MRILLYFFLGLTLLTKYSIAQDTTYLDSKIEYFTNKGDSYEELKKSKMFPKYSKEMIQISRASFKIEYCYYFDSKRNTSNYIRHFEITNDSVLTYNGEKWYFKKLDNNIFRVTKYDNGFTETGVAYSIIPFIKNGDFINLNNSHDTLLIEHFEMDKYISTTIPKTVFKDSIYTVVDESPKFPSKYGDLNTYIFNHYCPTKM